MGVDDSPSAARLAGEFHLTVVAAWATLALVPKLDDIPLYPGAVAHMTEVAGMGRSTRGLCNSLRHLLYLAVMAVAWHGAARGQSPADCDWWVSGTSTTTWARWASGSATWNRM